MNCDNPSFPEVSGVQSGWGIMCGRYASARKRIELLEEFGVQRDRVTESLEPDYNVAPTKPIYAVLTRRARSRDGDGPPGGGGQQDGGQSADGGQPDAPGSAGTRGSGAAGGTGGPASASGPEAEERTASPGETEAPGQAGGQVARELRVVRWGLVPSWAKDISIGSRLINARAETVAEKPAFRRAFERRRCLLPADGYFEWQVPASGTGPKQPFYITRRDGGPLAFAGLYELWRDHQVPDGDPRAWLWSATIITTSAPDELGQIHDRMPMVIDQQSWDDWLDPANSAADALSELLAPAATSGLISYPVSRAVNSVRNNGPDLIEPDEPDSGGAATPLSATAAGQVRQDGGIRKKDHGSEPGTLF
jgi:putative SOS response-associated peptidase YedK